MRKILSILILTMVVFSFTSCNESVQNNDDVTDISTLAIKKDELEPVKQEDILEFELFISPMYDTFAIKYVDDILNGYDFDSEYNDSVVTIKTTKSTADEILKDIEQRTKDLFNKYKDNGKLNNVTIDNLGATLLIDYTNDAKKAELSQIFGSFIDYLTIQQAFNGIKADDYGISITITFEDEFFKHLVINKQFYE